MKKYIFFFAAAVASFAACSKNEVTPAFSDENAETTFNVAPKTKAVDPAHQSDFSHDNVFTSYAYYLAPGKTWATNFATAQLYIDNSEISYVGDLWKNKTTTYYWPKDGGSLTFFAYSLNKADRDFGANSGMGISVATASDGSFVGGINGGFDVQTNKNVDLLVADVAADKKANKQTYAHTGVPTLFRHKLSMVNVTAKLQEYYVGKTFTINDIKFNQISHYASYCQIPESMTPGGTKIDQVYAENAAYVVPETRTTVPYVIKNAEGVKTDDGQYIYIPQAFDSDDMVIEIKYTVTTTVGTSTVKEECVSKTKISDIFPKWEIGKKYVLDLTFSLNEIHWDPAVEEWETATSGSITIE